jgi:PAP2 superfamily
MMRGAVAGASAPVLQYGFPLDSAAIDAVLRNEEAAVPAADHAAFLVGEGIGRAVATTVINRARNDRFIATWTGTVPTGPGKWSSLANPPAPPAFPLGGEIVTLFLTSGRQFRPAPPPAFGSGAFRDGLAEVRRISDTRTATQDSLAKFWAMATGTLVAGYWNTAALQLITTERVGERDAAHVLALMNAAGWDALTACHDAKYTYWLIRPSGADPAITTAIGVPNHPSFPSNHACLSGSSAQILGAMFPAHRAGLAAKAQEAAISRVYAGIHYRFDAEAGLALANKVASRALELDRRGWLRYSVRP